MAAVSYIRLAQLTDIVQQVIEDTLDGYLFWVIAEVTSHTYKARSHHHYFELVEKDKHTSSITARLQARAWKEGALQIADFEQATGQRFGNDLQVLVRVAVNFHPAYGLQAIVVDIDTSYTLGALEKQKQETLLRLVRDNPEHVAYDGEVYTTYNQRHRLPAVIRRVAVISSSTSAGLEDFQHSLAHNAYGYVVAADMYYALMQGENNSRFLVEQLVAIFNSGIIYDLVVIIRGGGAQIDFLLFEQYAIGRAIARFPVPVLTGIGHQKNETIADLMAHTSVKTPTKAAEFILTHNRSFEEELLATTQLIIIGSRQLLADTRQALTKTILNTSHLAAGYLNNRKEELTQQLVIISQLPYRQIFEQNSRLKMVTLKTGWQARWLLQHKNHILKLQQQYTMLTSRGYLKNRHQELAYYKKVAQLMQPTKILYKGFALLKNGGTGTVDTGNLQPGDQFTLVSATHHLEVSVIQITAHDETELNLRTSF